MSIDGNRLSIRQLTDFAQVEALYKTRLKKDFARNELRPLVSLRRSWERTPMTATAFSAGRRSWAMLSLSGWGSAASLTISPLRRSTGMMAWALAFSDSLPTAWGRQTAWW